MNSSSYSFVERKRKAFATAVLMTAALAAPSHAAIIYWDVEAGAGNGVGGTGTWGTTFSATSNGSATLTTASSGDDVNFQGSAGTVTFAADQAVSASAFKVTGYTLTTSGSSTRVFNSATGFTIADNTNLSIFTPGNGALTLRGGGVTAGAGSSLSITGANSSSTDAVRINLDASASIAASVPITILTTGSKGLAGIVAISTRTIGATITNNTDVTTMLGATSNNTLTLSGVISGSADVQFSAGTSGGAGTINLGAANAYTGRTLFNGSTSGVVKLTNANGISTASNVVMGFTSGQGQSLDLNGFDQTVASIASNGGGGSITNNASNKTSTLSINGGNTSAVYALTLKDGTGTNSKLALKLAATNTGKLSLAGANSYTGGTTIGGGTLRADSTDATDGSTGSGGVIIDSGGTLAGGSTAASGRVIGAVTVNTGGTITAGSGATTADAVGTLTTGGQTWVGGGRYVAKFKDTTSTAGTGWDQLAMSSLNVTASAGNKFTIALVNARGSAFTFAKNAQYAIATFGTALTADQQTSALAALALDTSGVGLSNSGLKLEFGNSGTTLFLDGDGSVANPEPMTALLAGMGGVVLLGRRCAGRGAATRSLLTRLLWN